jgi:phage shock protein C
MSEQPQPQQPYQQPQPPYGQQAPPPPPGPGYKRLTRASWDAPVSGVCGGLAHYLGIDPTLVRVLAVIAMLLTFPVGPIVYAVLWAVMPKQ